MFPPFRTAADRLRQTLRQTGRISQHVHNPSNGMPEPWSDRQVILAIALTLILVLGLILGSASLNREQQAPFLWREQPQPKATPLAI